MKVKSSIQAGGVRRPLLYAIVALATIALAVPMAVSSGQTQLGGIFDECYGDACDDTLRFANKED